MKNTKKAFTLVELIVVITILAVLATVAFISFSGQTQEAKKTKIVSDIANLAKAVELNDTGLKKVLRASSSLLATNAVTGTGNSVAFSGGLGATDNYMVGLVDFAVVNQNPEEFKDSDGSEYLFAYFIAGKFAKYQIIGQAADAAGDNIPLVKWSYFPVSTTDTDGLVSYSGASTAALTHDLSITTNSIY